MLAVKINDIYQLDDTTSEGVKRDKLTEISFLMRSMKVHKG